MARTKKLYMNGQKRGGERTEQVHSATPKDYRRQMVNFHGGEMALEKAMEKALSQGRLGA